MVRFGTPAELICRPLRRVTAIGCAFVLAISLPMAVPDEAGAVTGVPDLARTSNPACSGNALIDYGFLDVSENHAHRDSINCLAHHGVSVGVGDGRRYAPDDQVSRSQMALFMKRSALVAGISLPDPVDHGLTDLGDVSAVVRDAVNQLVSAGMANGQTATQYRPYDKVSRAEMALFILDLLANSTEQVVKEAAGVTLRNSSGEQVEIDDWFTDVESEPAGDSVGHDRAAAALFELGVASGTAPGTFSPSKPVTRAQMAAFITRALAFTAARPKDVAPRAPVRITVPTTAATGTCAYSIGAGIYEWEECAWSDHVEDRGYNDVVTDDQARELAARIWKEVLVSGKPDKVPTMEIVPAGTECASGETIGCYIPSSHHIRRLDSFRYVLLHELAHALIEHSPEVEGCRSAADYQKCVHGDLFRCVAAHLYVVYAGIPDPGVCGTTESDAATSVVWRSGSETTTDPLTQEEAGIRWSVLEALESHVSGYQLGAGSLHVRCRGGDSLDVYLELGGALAFGIGDSGSPYYQDVPVAYRFGTDNEIVHDYWIPSTTYEAAFVPEQSRFFFLNQLFDSEAQELVIRVYEDVAGQSVVGTFVFYSRGVRQNIGRTIEACGYEVGESGVEVYPAWADPFFDLSTAATLPSYDLIPSGPYDGTGANLVAICRDSDLDVYLSLTHGLMPTDPILVAYRIGSDGWVDESWSRSIDGGAAFAPYHRVDDLVEDLLGSEGKDIIISVRDENENDFATFKMRSIDVRQHLEPVLQACGR